MEEIFKNIIKRRSIRSYKEKQLEEEELQIILEAGRHAPTTGNRQDVHYTVIQNSQILNTLNALCKEEFLKLEGTEQPQISVRRNIERSKKENYDFFYHAPTLIVLSHLRSEAQGICDCSAAVENMMLMASAMEIGTCWISALKWLCDNTKIIAYTRDLGIPDNEVIHASMTIGYPSIPIRSINTIHGNRIDYIR